MEGRAVRRTPRGRACATRPALRSPKPCTPQSIDTHRVASGGPARPDPSARFRRGQRSPSQPDVLKLTGSTATIHARMKLNPLRRKPGWESRDPAERARALAHAPLADLGPRLADFVRADPAPEVRRAALKRLDDLALLADRMRHDDDDGVRDVARARYREMLVDASRPVAERERVVHVEDDQDVLGFVATQAAEPALRRVALERVSRPGTPVARRQREPAPEMPLRPRPRKRPPPTP